MRSDTSESDSAGFSPEEVNDLRTEASAEALGSSSMPSQEDAAPGPLLRAVTLLLDEHEISIASMAAGGSEFENRRDPAGDTSEAHSESESSLFEEDELGEAISIGIAIGGENDEDEIEVSEDDENQMVSEKEDHAELDANLEVVIAAEELDRDDEAEGAGEITISVEGRSESVDEVPVLVSGDLLGEAASSEESIAEQLWKQAISERQKAWLAQKVVEKKRVEAEVDNRTGKDDEPEVEISASPVHEEKEQTEAEPTTPEKQSSKVGQVFSEARQRQRQREQELAAHQREAEALKKAEIGLRPKEEARGDEPDASAPPVVVTEEPVSSESSPGTISEEAEDWEQQGDATVDTVSEDAATPPPLSKLEEIIAEHAGDESVDEAAERSGSCEQTLEVEQQSQQPEEISEFQLEGENELPPEIREVAAEVAKALQIMKKKPSVGETFRALRGVDRDEANPFVGGETNPYQMRQAPEAQAQPEQNNQVPKQQTGSLLPEYEEVAPPPVPPTFPVVEEHQQQAEQVQADTGTDIEVQSNLPASNEVHAHEVVETSPEISAPAWPPISEAGPSQLAEQGNASEVGDPVLPQKSPTDHLLTSPPQADPAAQLQAPQFPPATGQQDGSSVGNPPSLFEVPKKEAWEMTAETQAVRTEDPEQGSVEPQFGLGQSHPPATEVPWNQPAQESDQSDQTLTNSGNEEFPWSQPSSQAPVQSADEPTEDASTEPFPWKAAEQLGADSQDTIASDAEVESSKEESGSDSNEPFPWKAVDPNEQNLNESEGGENDEQASASVLPPPRPPGVLPAMDTAETSQYPKLGPLNQSSPVQKRPDSDSESEGKQTSEKPKSGNTESSPFGDPFAKKNSASKQPSRIVSLAVTIGMGLVIGAVLAYGLYVLGFIGAKERPIPDNGESGNPAAPQMPVAPRATTDPVIPKPTLPVPVPGPGDGARTPWSAVNKNDLPALPEPPKEEIPKAVGVPSALPDWSQPDDGGAEVGIPTTTEYPEPEKVLRKFFAAPDWFTRIRYCQHPDKIIDKMREYYKNNPDGPIGALSVELKVPGRTRGETNSSYIYEVKTVGSPRPFPVSVINTGEDYRVDWEPFVQCQDSLLEKFAASPRAGTGEFYVVLKRMEWDPREVSSPDKPLLAFTALAPHLARPGVKIFLPEESEMGKQIAKSMQWEMGYFRVVELAWEKSSAGHDYLELKRIVSNNWKPYD